MTRGPLARAVRARAEGNPRRGELAGARVQAAWAASRCSSPAARARRSGTSTATSTSTTSARGARSSSATRTREVHGGASTSGRAVGHQLRRADRARGRASPSCSCRARAVDGEGAPGLVGHRGHDGRAARRARLHQARQDREDRRRLPRRTPTACWSTAGSGVATLGIPGSAGVTDGTAARHAHRRRGTTSAAMQRRVRRERRQIAAVIVEPVCGNMGCVPPRPATSRALRTLTREARHGARSSTR